MRIEQVMMSPEQAAKLLKSNDRNRSPSEALIANLAAQMKSGGWKLNGETIIVDRNGQLMDGQHRLSAVVVAGVPVPMLVVWDAEPSAFTTIDTGRSRKNSDFMSALGHKQATRLAAAAATIWKMYWEIPAQTKCPAEYAIQVVERYPSIDGWMARYVGSKTLRSIIPAGTIVPALVYLSDIANKPELAARIVDGLDRGMNLTDGDPILALRNRMINYRSSGGRTDIFSLWPAVVKTVNALEAGEQITKLQIPKTSLVQRPAKFSAHMSQIADTRDLRDLTPPTQFTFKVRSQNDIMNKIVMGNF